MDNETKEITELKAILYDIQKELDVYHAQDEYNRKSIVEKLKLEADRVARGDTYNHGYMSYLQSVEVVESCDDFCNNDGTINHDIAEVDFPRIRIEFALGQTVNVVMYVKYTESALAYYGAMLGNDIMPTVVEM